MIGNKEEKLICLLMAQKVIFLLIKVMDSSDAVEIYGRALARQETSMQPLRVYIGSPSQIIVHAAALVQKASAHYVVLYIVACQKCTF